MGRQRIDENGGFGGTGSTRSNGGTEAPFISVAPFLRGDPLSPQPPLTQKLNCPVSLTNRAGMNEVGRNQVVPYVPLYVNGTLEFVTL
jgi:hypothetical protein